MAISTALTTLLLALGTLAVERATIIPALGPDGAQRVEILAGNYYFRPAEVVVKAGYPVELVVRELPSISRHDFTLKAHEAGMDLSLPLGTRPRTIRFIPTRPGKYPFYCSQRPPLARSHRERGMVGILEVME